MSDIAKISEEELRNNRLRRQQLERIEQLKKEQQEPVVPEVPEVPAVEVPQSKEEVVEAASSPAIEAKTAQKIERPEGIVTQVGNALGYLVDGAALDGVNAIAAGVNQLAQPGAPVKPVTEWLDKNIWGSEELEAAKLAAAERSHERRQSGEASALEATLDTVANSLEGISAGLEGGIALPFTVAARLSNQATPWADPPETLKDSPVGQTLFEITQVLTPTVLTLGYIPPGASLSVKGLTLLKSGGIALATESAIETATQDSFDDLIGGRTLARAFGELADAGGFDGGQLTRDLIEGKTFNAQALAFGIGFLQNLGINHGFNEVVKIIGKKIRAREAAKAAKPYFKERVPVDQELKQWNGVDSTELSLDGQFRHADIVEGVEGQRSAQKIQTDLPDGWKLNWLFHDDNAAHILEELAESRANAIRGRDYSAITDVSKRQIDISWDIYEKGTSPLGRRLIRIRSFMNDFISKNLEPGDIVYNSPSIDDLDRMSQAQVNRHIQADVAVGLRQVEAIENALDQEEVWQYFGDLIGAGGATGEALDETALALKYLSEDEFRIFQQSINPRFQRMQPGIAGRADHYRNLINQRAANEQVDYSKEGVRKWWDGLTDEQKIQEAEVAINNDLVPEPDFSDLDPNIRAMMYERFGFSERDPLTNDQFGVVRAHPTSIGRIIEPINIEWGRPAPGTLIRPIQNVDEVKAAIQRAKNVRPEAPTIPTETSKKAAKVLKQNAVEVDDAITDIRNPNYTPKTEPHNVVDIDSSVPRPSWYNQYLSSEAFTAEAIRPDAILGEDGLTDAGRYYFSNWRAIVSQNNYEELLREATSTLKKLKAFPQDFRQATERALLWFDKNKGNIDNDLDSVVEAYREMVQPLKKGTAAQAGADLIGEPTEKVLRDLTGVTTEGFVAGQIIGEELGIRLSKLARIATNLDDNGIDFTKAVENYLELSEKLQLFMIPLRRGKRRWAVEGWAQNPRALRSLADDPDAAVARTNKHAANAPAREFETLTTDVDSGETFRELWEKFKAGDEQAGDAMKAWLNAVAYVDPHVTISQVDDISKIVREQLRLGRRSAVQQIYYGALLSRVSTQVASASSGIAQLVAEPLGDIAHGFWSSKLTKDGIEWNSDISYGIGRLIGGWGQMGDALEVGVRAWKENRSIIGGSKIAADIGNLAAKQVKQDEAYKGLLRQYAQEGADPATRFGAWLDYTVQRIGNHPAISTGMRALTAFDDSLKSTLAGQIATGRAWQEAALTDNFKDLDRLIDRHFKIVFEGGLRNGKISDPEVLLAAKRITFQDTIPTDGVGIAGFVDNIFLSLQNASNNSGFWRYFNPFVRVSYQTLESSARYSLVGNMPFLKQLLPKYDAILKGDLGPVAQQQLKSQIAFGRLWAASMVMTSAFNMLTGENPRGGLPKRSFIMPAPGTTAGYIAIPYGRLEPFASMTAFIADLTQALRDTALTQGQYDRALQEITFSIGVSTLDKSFMSGLTKMAETANVKNWHSTTNSSRIAARIIGGFAPSMGRMLGKVAYPYKALSYDNDWWPNFLAQLRQTVFGGVGNPPDYDPLTGSKVPKIATLGEGENYALASAGAILDEFTWAGEIQNYDKGRTITVRGNKKVNVKEEMRKVNFLQNPKFYASLSVPGRGGVKLNLKQQSIIKRDMALVGNLEKRLAYYFTGNTYKARLREYNKAKKKVGSANEQKVGGQETGPLIYLESIHADIQKIYQDAKVTAATALRGDPAFTKTIQKYDSKMEEITNLTQY